MSEKPYWQQRRDMKNGKAPADGKSNASGDDPEKDEGTPAKKKKPGKGLKKPQKPIKKRSKKQKGIMKDLKLAYGPFLEKNTACVIQSPVCTRQATCVNHKAGRGVNEVLNKKTWEPSCGPCNSWIEEHDAWARENGHKTSRLGKPHKIE